MLASIDSFIMKVNNVSTKYFSDIISKLTDEHKHSSV